MRRMSTARRTALVSLVAAVVLVVVKAAVGFASGSLGVLAEAVHSGIDAVAAMLTLYAVGVAERPGRSRAPVRPRQGPAPGRAGRGAVPRRAPRPGSRSRRSMRLRHGSSPVDARWYVFA